MSVIVTGVQGVPLAPRQEIRTMMQDVPLFTLYLLAVRDMQAVPEDKPLSWFQIAGIHGFPNTPYDQDGGTKKSDGYCEHGTVLFPGWHRPYLALFEQALAAHVKSIANKYPVSTREKYVRAAEKFRIPYWDWAYYADPPDVVSREEEFLLETPEGIKPVKNPLLSYKFKDPNFSYWPTTLRWPTSDSRNASSQAPFMDQVLDNQKLHTRDLTVNLLASKGYQAFSQEGRSNAPRERYISLESLHNLYHGLVGGNVLQLSRSGDVEGRQILQGHERAPGGQMGGTGYAAFDPMFMMHHANVDRLFAIWQALNPGTYEDYFTNVYKGPASLRPFRKSITPKGVEYWTALGVMDTRNSFNYTYPELVEWSSLGKDAKQERLMQIITEFYRSKSPVGVLEPGLFSGVRAPIRPIDPRAPSSFASRLAAAKEAPAPTTNTASIKPPVESVASVSSTDVHQIATSTGPTTPKHYNDWNANIVVEKYSVKTSFFVHVFLGDFDPNPANWLTQKTLVGSYYVFTSDIETTGCGRCKENAANNFQVTGSVPLTGALLDSPLADRLGKDKVALLSPDEMVPYLKKELHWRVQTQAGDVVELKDIPSLKISVVHYPATTPTNPLNFATKGQGTVYTAATTGRLGGLGEDDLTIKPPTTYTPEVTPEQAYDTKKPSGTSYGTTYDTKPPSGSTYDAKPPSGSTYTPPSGNDYNSNPPSTTYNPKPTHGPGYVHKDCSCGADIASDCSCKGTKKTVVIDGHIREDVRRCSYEFDLPCNHIAVMYGVRTAIYEQIVNVTIRRKSERKAYKDWSFEGKEDAGLLNLEGSRGAYNLNIQPEDVDRVVVITFQSYVNGEYKSSDMRYKEVVISTDTSKYCSYFYTFFVEAGDDCDYHDTDFCVSVLPSKK